MKLYHISEENLDSKTLIPRIPNNWLTSEGYEDNKIARVCFSETIDGCLISICREGIKEYYVHELVEQDDNNIISPSEKQVGDVRFTGEKWYTSPAKLKVIQKIMIIGSVEQEMTINYGDELFSVYKWKYETVETYK